MTRFSLRHISIALCFSLLAMAQSATAAYPEKPVRIVSSFPAGSISDTLSRIVGEKLGAALGQTFLVENRPGANGSVGAIYVGHAKPDGYTLMMGTNSINAINPSLFKSLNYDPARDFAPIGMVAEIPAVIIARKDLPFHDLKSLIDYARRHGGPPLSFASGTATAQVAGEVLKQKAGIELLNVPYRGEPPGLTDLLGGQVDLMILNLPIAYPYIQNGDVKVISLLGAQRTSLLPNVATANETLPGYVVPTGWNALFAPAGTPQATIDRLSGALQDALKSKDIRGRIEATAGTSVAPGSPRDLETRVADDARRWADMIRAAGIAAQ